MLPLGGANSFPGGRIGSETSLAGGFSEPPIGTAIGVGISWGGLDLDGGVPPVPSEPVSELVIGVSQMGCPLDVTDK